MQISISSQQMSVNPRAPVLDDLCRPRPAAGQTGAACAGDARIYTWQEALACCEGAIWAGFTDRYLPSIAELASIVDDRRLAPGIDAAVFPATPSNWFWSSSSQAGDSSRAWYVGFAGSTVGHYRKASPYYVRCVRRGP
jgi:hypothetical protein